MDGTLQDAWVGWRSAFLVNGSAVAEVAEAAERAVASVGAPAYVAAAVGSRERWMFALSSVAALEAVFWTCQVFYWAIDHFDLLPQYRILKRQPYPPRQLVIKCLREVLGDHLVVRPLVLFATYPIFAALLEMGPSLPSWQTVLWQVLVCTQIDDFLFYWSHRLAHHRWFYSWIHKQHHEFKHCLPIAVEYAHPLEGLLVNSLSSAAGPLLLGTHVLVFWLYSCLKVYQSIDAHSSFALPFPLSPWTIEWLGVDCSRAHDFHHSHNVGMYGGYTRFWDWAMGTDAHYRAYRARQLASNSADKRE